MSGFSIGIDKKIPRNFARNKNSGTAPHVPMSRMSEDEMGWFAKAKVAG